MNFSEFPGRDSDIHRLDPRLRVIAAFVLTVMAACCNSIPALSILFLSGFLLNSMASIKVSEIKGRLLFLNIFVLMTYLSLPLSSLGNLCDDENILFLLRIALKINAALFFTTSLLCTMDPSEFGHALIHLKVPEKMIHIFLFSLKFLDIMRMEYLRLKEAAKARAFKAGTNLHSLKTAADMTAMLIIKSLDRASITSDAMKARCFRGLFFRSDHFSFKESDTIAALLFTALAGATIFSEFIHK